MLGYIYKTTNLANGKLYIGQHKSAQYDSEYFGSGKLKDENLTFERITTKEYVDKKELMTNVTS